MATSTNLGLYLPTREDYISVKRDLSDNYEIIDAAVGGNTQGIAQIQSETDIMINGATSTSNVTIGQFVTVRNSSITGIADGVYKALANVTAGTSFVAANLQAVTGGALNKIVSDTNAMIQQQENDMDIVVRGNTASVNVTAGQFVTVRDSTIANISDGVYKAANNVSSGVPFTDADLNDISSGALNELVSDLTTLNEHIVRNETWIQHSALANYSQGIGLPSSWRALYVLISNSGSSVPEYYTFTVYSWSPVARFISGYGGDGFCYCTFVIENNTLVIGGHKYKGEDYTPKVAIYYM